MSIDWSKAPEGATHATPSGTFIREERGDRFVAYWEWLYEWVLIESGLEKDQLIERPKKRLTLVEQLRSIEKARKHSHYFKDVSGVDQIDVYAVLRLFEVTDPCLQHIVKKALCAGKRGAKDWAKDVQEIADTAQRLIELESAK